MDSGEPLFFCLPDCAIQDFGRLIHNPPATDSLVGQAFDLLDPCLPGSAVHFFCNLLCLGSYPSDHRPQNAPAPRTGSVTGSFSQLTQNHVDIPPSPERMAQPF
jgi:hypothetical protein